MNKNKENHIIKKPTFWNVFVLILMVTFIGFGGGNALMPVIKRYAVDKYEWLDSDEFDKNVVITNMLPGPMAIEALSYIAMKTLGFWKGFLVVLFASLPHIVVTIALFFVLSKLPLEYLYVVQVGVLVAIVGSLIGFSWSYFKKGIKSNKIGVWTILFLITMAFSLFVPTPYNVPVAIMFLIIGIFAAIYCVQKRKNIKKLKCQLKQEKIIQNTDKSIENVEISHSITEVNNIEEINKKQDNINEVK
ncbi:chromate transporter [Mycoplasma zalophidermidis]|uniref:Chromate transporter n=1 Tax=Mycoplasma zalophidermidis TaxID=398174 RepID=A0ABS6DQT8_9MOLU|nr:chromate transporter [Mycoplasma zalophidermidis]MBU4689494.1 chromate transporter [Mycoplasma zalophidermidis]MBU4693372.1 chromate transporter [Mycoplasma zalophidermidis]